MTDASALIWFAVLLIANAFFVGAEFAVVAARRAQLEPKANAGSRLAKLTISGMEQVARLLATAQLGITVCSLLILNVVEPTLQKWFTVPLAALGVGKEVGYAIAFLIALVIVSYLHVVLGEMVPKNISISLPDRAALVLVPPLLFISQILAPLVWTLNGAANLVLKAFGVKPPLEARSHYTLDEVESIVEHSTRQGVLSDASGAISKTFEFTEKVVSDVAIPLASLVSVPMQTTPRQIEQVVAKHGFSRYPLLDPEGEPVGYLHLKDIIDLSDRKLDKPIELKRVRGLQSISEQAELEMALARMQRSGSHLLRAINRQGEVTGILFLEDVLEVLVGEVQDASQR